MNAKRLADLRSLLSHPDFQTWWRELGEARATLSQTEKTYEDLLGQTTLMEFRAELTQKNAIDTLYGAGELEDAAASLYFESAELENRSFQAVASFEEQRFKVSEIWYRLGSVERELEEKRDADTAAGITKPSLETEALSRTHKTLSEEYDREMAKRARLWEEVERIWDRSAEVGLLVAEHRLQGKKIRREAESRFALSDERKSAAKELRVEAEAAGHARESASRSVKRLLDLAKERFGCSAGEDFLYFRQKDNPKQAFCVALVEDKETYNIEVHPLAVYGVDRQRGVAFLEPVRLDAQDAQEGDQRFDDYFLKGRKRSGRSDESKGTP